MRSLIVALSLSLLLPQLAPSVASAEEPGEVSPVVYQSPLEPTAGRRKQRKRRRPKKKRRKPNAVLGCFWNIFPPPGDYQWEVGLAAGTTFTTTAYGELNPNLFLRGTVRHRIDPDLPVGLHATMDYNNYSQTAGNLSYDSRQLFFGAGGGLLYWLGPLRLDLHGELGPMLRISTQTDGTIEPLTYFRLSPTAGAVAGMGLALFGHVSLSLKGSARIYAPLSRVNYMVTGGLEWLIDADPIDVY